jgi:hypothetical protein
MLKYVVPANQLKINHDDILRYPKKAYRNYTKNKQEYKRKKRGQSKDRFKVFKGLRPQFPLKNTNIDIYSKIT